VLFLSLLSCYVLMLILGASIPVAILSAVAFAFSSYSIIILQAGHITKAWAMAYMPLILGGFLLVLKQKWFIGGFVFALFLALQLKSNHAQITYYLTLFCCIVYLGYAIRQIRERHWKSLGISLAVLAGGVLVAFLCNMGPLYANYELSQESIRGRSELTHLVDGKADKSSGLDKDYAFAWSYGVGETFTLLIPDFYGGASGGDLSQDSHVASELRRQGYQVPNPLQAYTYWGDQPFTSGPVYFGAIICMLFVFALFIIRHPLKWWIVGAMGVFLLLSWGRNFDSFNTFMFHYLPFYNKFRTVSMALVIPQLVFAFLAGWGLLELFRQKADKKNLLKALYYAVGITGGLCLFFALFTPMSFRSVLDAQYQMPDWYMNALVEDRAGLLRVDAFRSLWFILLGGGCLYLYIRSDKPSHYLPYVLVGLVLVDLWGVDKRYLNESHFIKPNTTMQLHVPTVADRAILQDRDVSYRVLTLADPFNNSSLSYFHKNIGGYNAAKLRRYQDLIEMKLAPEIEVLKRSLSKATSEAEVKAAFQEVPALNMLNMRYLILASGQAPLHNPYAYGNAWFVPSVEIVENADEEMSRLQTVNSKKVALVDKRFQSMISRKQWETDSSAEIKLLTYKPDRLEYKYHSSEPGVVLFSEVYYPHGWKAMIDGQPAEHFRANWILRGMEVPAGEHTISFYFRPDSYLFGRWIATICSGLLVLAFILVLGYAVRKFSRQSTDKK
ncbi:MAG: YfhO family protein, partial [Odoribacter sp.]|nr:YfhO family protein [Odoribacter sp.]